MPSEPTDAEPWADPSHPGNGPVHHTGKPCISPQCSNPAGTAWSPFWCQGCNAKRIQRINKNMKEIANGFK